MNPCDLEGEQKFRSVFFFTLPQRSTPLVFLFFSLQTILVCVLVQLLPPFFPSPSEPGPFSFFYLSRGEHDRGSSPSFKSAPLFNDQAGFFLRASGHTAFFLFRRLRGLSPPPVRLDLVLFGLGCVRFFFSFGQGTSLPPFCCNSFRTERVAFSPPTLGFFPAKCLGTPPQSRLLR